MPLDPPTDEREDERLTEDMKVSQFTPSKKTRYKEASKIFVHTVLIVGFVFCLLASTVGSRKANFRHGCHLICHGKTKLTRIPNALTPITMIEGVNTRAWWHYSRLGV